MIRELHINLPLVDVLKGMTKYYKHLKDMVINKVNYQDINTMGFIEECRSVVVKKMPKKIKDPTCFTLLINIVDG